MTNPYLHKLVERYAPKYGNEPREFVEPVPDDYFIWWLFKHRCIMCSQTGHEINEINPRGRSKFAILDWRNRVILCVGCHREFHRNGVTDKKQEEMRVRRAEFLVSVGRGQYV